MTLTYTMEQLREAMQLQSREALRKRVSHLEQHHGFPPRLPGEKNALWSKPAVDRWFRDWGRPAEQGGGDDPIIKIRTQLERQHG